ncbi:hypothetical protein AB1L42_02320 [Thalassoglobus sp. JC818]|uniref:hypothetical protein n=1 Tax=Thalassoglobus sp. JC818 TaxID=3232136 RepID=UPI003457F4F0
MPAQLTPGLNGGRPPTDHFTVLKVMWFVLTVGCRWKDVRLESGFSDETASTGCVTGKRLGFGK